MTPVTSVLCTSTPSTALDHKGMTSNCTLYSCVATHKTPAKPLPLSRPLPLTTPQCTHADSSHLIQAINFSIIGCRKVIVAAATDTTLRFAV